jgi:DNA-binding MurR/RpiR family transcriptional regulator
VRDQTPETLSDLLDEITQQRDQLSKRLRQVADFVLQSPSDVAFGTVATLSKQSKVHPSTWVRFANSFGFGGFTDMQRLFKTNLMQEIPNYQERVRTIKEQQNTASDPLSPSHLLTEFSQANVLALENLALGISDSELQKAIHILMEAKAAYVMGVRRAFVVASYFTYALQHINQKAHLVNGMGGMYDEQTSNFHQDDALIAVSFYPYAPETQAVVSAAIKKNMPIIVITDSPLSPLAKVSDVSFVVEEAEIHKFRSLSSSLVLAQSLAIALAYELEEKREGK